MGSICSYTMLDVNDLDMSVDTAMDDGDSVNFALPTDRRYSTFFEISNAAGIWIIPGVNFSEIYVLVHNCMSGSKTMQCLYTLYIYIYIYPT